MENKCKQHSSAGSVVSLTQTYVHKEGAYGMWNRLSCPRSADTALKTLNLQPMECGTAPHSENV